MAHSLSPLFFMWVLLEQGEARNRNIKNKHPFCKTSPSKCAGFRGSQNSPSYILICLTQKEAPVLKSCFENTCATASAFFKQHPVVTIAKITQVRGPTVDRIYDTRGYLKVWTITRLKNYRYLHSRIFILLLLLLLCVLSFDKRSRGATTTVGKYYDIKVCQNENGNSSVNRKNSYVFVTRFVLLSKLIHYVSACNLLRFHTHALGSFYCVQQFAADTFQWETFSKQVLKEP